MEASACCKQQDKQVVMFGIEGGAEEAASSSFLGSDLHFKLLVSNLKIPGDFDCMGKGGPGCSMSSNNALTLAALEGVAFPVDF